MNRFQEATTAIQVGVRQATPVGSGQLEGYAGGSPERIALVELGTMDLMRRAGAKPETAPSLEPCPPETGRVSLVADDLAELLALRAEPVIREWAEAAGRAGFVAPPEALIDLLRLSKKMRLAVRPVLGERGRWLAQLMRIEIEEPPGDDPNESRTLLTEEWETLDYRELVRHLTIVAKDVRPDDEPLLNRGFGDRRKEIRVAAAEGLIHLEGSAASRELEAFVERIVVMERRLLRRTLEFVPPDPATIPAWLPRAANRPGLGPLALALLDIVRRIRPGLWQERIGMDVPEIVERGAKSEYGEALLEGWQWATLRFQNREWADALYRHGNDGKTMRVDVTEIVSDAAFESVIADRLKGGPEQAMRAASSVGHRHRTLSPELSRAFVKAVRKTQTDPSIFNSVAYVLHPSVLPELRMRWGEEPGPEEIRQYWRKILELRERLLQSLQP